MGNEGFYKIANELHLKSKDSRENSISNVILRKARVSDVGDILKLVNSNAEATLLLPRGPKYLYENIRDFLVVESHSDNTEFNILGCGSLHILWKDIAEIRALAIQNRYQQCGLGSKIVQFLIKEAEDMVIEKVYALTKYPDFFKKLGFQQRKRSDLPRRLWGECIKCPKYFRCDETGLLFNTLQA